MLISYVSGKASSRIKSNVAVEATLYKWVGYVGSRNVVREFVDLLK